MRFTQTIFSIIYLLFLFSCASRRKEESKNLAVKAPEENRFTKTVFLENLKEPMELAVTDQGVIFWIERYGEVNRYDPATGKATVIGKVDVFAGNNDGLLGLALDPAFESNNQLYLFYSPAGTVPKQHISRFTVQDNQMDMASEKVILEIPTQRELCCHSAGSLEFAPNGDLYIAVGDNTNPWEQDGYSPQDERSGKANFDSQRTAANTHDLRGKILRIRPELDIPIKDIRQQDGSAQKGNYTIPEGNLFPKDGSKGRAEIYAMGTRNPFRMSVDSKTAYLYFGDIGPDANVASKKGPVAYEEINVAKKPGNYGWPYFIGNNIAYPKVDFATQAIGGYQNPNTPVNNSPNNTGQRHLPPAQKAMIWYSGEESKEFPGLGKGGRSALAGPVYRFDPNLASEVKFPAYYDNCLFIYDWMRDWIKVVKLDEKGDYASMESFMSATEFSSPVDMAFGKDGALYVLEYGSGWYSSNKDAKLSRITFNKGNRPPMVKVSASVTAGKAPLTVQFSSKGTVEYDGDAPLIYQWRFDSTSIPAVSSNEPNPIFTFQKSGIYQVQLTVSDPKGEKSKASVEVMVGNTPPEIAIEVTGNRMFFWDNAPMSYQVQVADKEDGSLADGGIRPADVFVFLDYSSGGDNLSPMLTSHQQVINSPGKQLIDGSDCKSCHLPDQKSIGPSYQEVAVKYKNDPHALDRLADKVIKGGGGVWKKDFVMIAHPQLSKKAATEMVTYILSLGNEQKKVERIDVKGSLTLKAPENKADNGVYFITASYQDRGGNQVRTLTQKASLVLKSPKIQAESYDGGNRLKVMGTIEDGDSRHLNMIQNSSNVFYKGIDLTDIGAITYNIASSTREVSLEVHLDSLEGEMISVTPFIPTGELSVWKKVSAPIKKIPGIHDVYLIAKCKSSLEKNILQLDWLMFDQAERTARGK